MSESDVRHELHRHLRNEIQTGATYRGMTYTGAIPEYATTAGVADLVVEADDSAFLVIETTHPDDSARDIDPYSIAVVRRAAGHARDVGAPYFATYSGNTCVVFETLEAGTPLVDRNYRAFDVDSPREFAPELLEAVVNLHRGETGWPPAHEAFVRRLGTFHGRLADELATAFRRKVESDSGFADAYETWVDKQGWTDEYDDSPRRVRDRYLDQSAYLLMNRLLFYKLLTDADAYSPPEVDLDRLADPHERRAIFDALADELDFEAIYGRDGVLDALPIPDTARVEVEDFLDELDEYALTEFDHDVVGHLYQRLVPQDERRSLGQYYTPPKLVDFVTRTTVRDEDDVVLDPACGSGAFLVRAYNRLRELGDDAGHETILSQLYGVDVNRFPVHLAALNLAVRDFDAETRELDVERADFFDVESGQPPPSGERAGGADAAGRPEENGDFPTQVDAVVANPPYVRQELVDKERCRGHLDRNGFSVDIDERSDIYCYFFTHASEFLSANGRMGMVTPDKWLTVGYGEGLRQFFLDRFEIRAVVSFPNRAFSDALVPTCVTLLERAPDRAAREENTVKFVRLEGDVDLSVVESLVEADAPADLVRTDSTYRLVTKRQGDLRPGEKWDRYLHAPPVYWELVTRPDLVPLSEFADVVRGITSGANRVFYLSEAEADEWNIDSRFLEPLAKTVRGKDRPRLEREDVDRYVLDVHEYANEVSPDAVRPRERLNADLTRARRQELTERERDVLEALLEDGHDGTYRYLVTAMWDSEWQHGPPHERRTVRQRRRNRGLWFDLGELAPGELLPSKEYWEYGKPLAIVNEAAAVADQQLYVVETDRDPHVLGGILNSSWGALVRELHGRTTGGGMNRVAVYEAEALPVPDPRAVDGDVATRIREAFGAFLDGADARRELDRSVLAAIGAERRADEVRESAKALAKARQEGTETGAFSTGGRDH